MPDLSCRAKKAARPPVDQQAVVAIPTSVPVERNGDAGLKAMLEPDYHRPWWHHGLGLVALALVLAVAAAGVAAAIYEVGKAAGEAFKHFVSTG